MNPLRHAASRFLSSPLSYTSRSISRSRCALPIQTGTSTLALQTPYASALQIRWNSSKDDAEPPLPQESQVSEQLLEQEGQQALENEDAPKETREAQRKRQTRFQYLDQQTRLLEEYDSNPPSETVYVGNIFYDIAAEDLRKHFEAYGVVLKSMIVHDNRGLSKGFGYVQFNTVEEAANAIENQHLQILEGRTVVVQFARSQIEHKAASGPPSNCLFIGNIPFELTDRDLQELIRDVHNIIDVRVPVDRRSGVPRGFAHVEFLDVESAARAKDILSRKAPYGRKLRVNFTDRRKVGIGMMNVEQGSRADEGEGRE